MKSLVTSAVILCIGTTSSAQEVRYVRDDGGAAIFKSLRETEDSWKLYQAHELKELPPLSCFVESGTKVVILDDFKTNFHDIPGGYEYLIIYRVKVVSGPHDGCEGYTIPGSFAPKSAKKEPRATKSPVAKPPL